MARRAEDEVHLPKPKHAGEVIEAPYYVRVRPGWLEQWLFAAVLVQIFLGLLFLTYGSGPARGLQQEVEINRKIICDAVKVSDPAAYVRFQRRGYC